jgi:hypothetical protein
MKTLQEWGVRKGGCRWQLRIRSSLPHRAPLFNSWEMFPYPGQEPPEAEEEAGQTGGRRQGGLTRLPQQGGDKLGSSPRSDAPARPWRPTGRTATGGSRGRAQRQAAEAKRLRAAHTAATPAPWPPGIPEACGAGSPEQAPPASAPHLPPTRTGARRTQPSCRRGCSKTGLHWEGRRSTSDHCSVTGWRARVRSDSQSPPLRCARTAAAFLTNRQLRRALRERRSLGNVSLWGGAQSNGWNSLPIVVKDWRARQSRPQPKMTGHEMKGRASR